MKDIGFVLAAFFLVFLFKPALPGKMLGEAVAAYSAAVGTQCEARHD